MRKLNYLTVLLLLLLSLANIHAVSQVSFGVPVLFNDDWEFSLDSTVWRPVTLPHDWSIEATPSPDLASCTGYLPGGIGYYRKTFTLNDKLPQHYIYFEGVYNRSEVYINGHLLGKRPNGYISFMYELTPFLRRGANEILVRVDHSKFADSRWYTGSGIYRNAWLIASNKTPFKQWGIGYEAIKGEDDNWKLKVKTEIEGDTKGLSLILTLADRHGAHVASTSCKDISMQNTATIGLKNPHLWNLDNPYLYTLHAQLQKDGSVIDSASVMVGIRSLQFDANKGFALNGKWMKVKGVCLHHDAGVLGAAVPKDVWHRRLLALKDIGANAIRMSHNPQAPDLYDLCDELGFLVMDEGSDEWEFPKRKWLKGWNKGEPGFDGTYDFFEEWIECDITDMVRRDRNHPCVFLWSVGNEVDYPNDPYSHPILDGNNSKINQPMFGGYKPDAPNAERIGKIAKRLARCIRNVDTSRPVTGALAGVVMSNETEYPQAVDVVGYNYTENRYIEDHNTYPDRIIYGSETHGSIEAWKAVRDNEHIFGQFVWTGMDYLGESGAWPSRGLGTGLLDFAGFPKMQGEFFKSLWAEKPMIYITAYHRNRRPKTSQPHDHKTSFITCFTNACQARLMAEGKVVGEMKLRNDSTGVITWQLPQSYDRLEAEACDDAGKVVARYTLEQGGVECKLRITDITIDKQSEVKQILVEAIDAEGKLVRYANRKVVCRTKGSTVLLGLENGNNTDMSSPKVAERQLHNGRLVAYIKGDVSDVDFNLF